MHLSSPWRFQGPLVRLTMRLVRSRGRSCGRSRRSRCMFRCSLLKRLGESARHPLSSDVQPEAHPHGAVARSGVDAHGREHVRGLHLARRAGRARRHSNAVEVERDQQRLAPTCPAPRKRSYSAAVARSAPKMTASGAIARKPASSASRSSRSARHPSSRLRAQPQPPRRSPAMAAHVLGAGAVAALLPAAAHQRHRRYGMSSLGEYERAGALRAADLVRGNDQQHRRRAPRREHRCGRPPARRRKQRARLRHAPARPPRRPAE